MRRLFPSPHTFTLAPLLQEKTNKMAEDFVHLSHGMCLGVEKHIYLIVGAGGGKQLRLLKAYVISKKATGQIHKKSHRPLLIYQPSAWVSEPQTVEAWVNALQNCQ